MNDFEDFNSAIMRFTDLLETYGNGPEKRDLYSGLLSLSQWLVNLEKKINALGRK